MEWTGVKNRPLHDESALEYDAYNYTQRISYNIIISSASLLILLRTSLVVHCYIICINIFFKQVNYTLCLQPPVVIKATINFVDEWVEAKALRHIIFRS